MGSHWVVRNSRLCVLSCSFMLKEFIRAIFICSSTCDDPAGIGINVHLEVLADRADHWLVRGGELPVHSIVKHVEEDDDLVSDADLMITEQLHEELLYPLELSFVIRNLSKEQGTLELLKKFLGFESLAATEFVNILYVGLLSECVLVNVEVHLL